MRTYAQAPQWVHELNAWNKLQYQVLRRIAPAEQALKPSAFEGRSKLHTQLGDTSYRELLACRTVVDFGCGGGEHAIELARAGVQHVIGLEIRQSLIDQAREAAAQAGVSGSCEFTSATSDKCDAVVSMDSFEHYSDPAGVLSIMHSILRAGGRAYVSFGPPWYHPIGGHLFSILPWAHLLFSESALCAWRSHIRDDGATRFHEVEGGLNKMTIRRFEALVAASPFVLESLEILPIRKLARFHNRWTREFTSALIRATLRKP